MDPLERQILAAFDSSAGERVLGSHVRSLSMFGDSPDMREAVQRLINQGWLRAADSQGCYRRTEDGRLQLAAPRDVTIYSRPGCHLCEEAKAQIVPLLKEFSARLTEINIDEDPDLRASYDYDVPVIFLGARKVGKHRLDCVQFRRQLSDADLA